MTFPRSIPTDAETSVIDLADLDGDSKSEIIFISKTKKDRSSEYSLQAIKHIGGDDWQPVKFGDKTSDPARFERDARANAGGRYF